MKSLLHILITALLVTFISPISKAQNNALVINGDYIVMNGGTLATNNFIVVDQPSTSGIITTGSGFIISEAQYNYVKWNAGANTGNYVFPFGTYTTTPYYIPFTFNKTTGASANVFTSTWHTNQQNVPHPTLSDVAGVTSMNCGSMNALGDSVTAVIDRFWDIQTTAAATANLTFSYLGSENTTANSTATFEAEHWNSTSWDVPVGAGTTGVTTNVGTVGPTTGQSTFSPWALVSIVPTFTATGSTTICGGTTTTLSASGAVTYTWMPGALTGSVVSVNPAATTIYTVTGTNTNGCKTINPVTVTVTVNPLPTYSILPIASPSICSGGSVTFTVSGASTYTWSTGQMGANTTVTPTITTNYSVTGTSTAGCVNTTPLTVTVNVTAPPTLSIVGSNNPSICKGSSITLSVSPSGLGTGNYTWSPGGASTSTVTVSPTTQTIYTVGATASGCATSIPVTVTVNVNPLPTYTIAPIASPSICAGASQTLTVSGASTYTWSTGQIVPTITVTPVNTTTYSVIGTSTAGCINPVPATVTVNVNPLPTYTLLPNSSPSICSGGSVTFSVTGANTYTWTTNLAGSLTGANTANPVASPTATASYSVVGTNTVTGCSNSSPAVITVNVTAPPILSIVGGNNQSLCSGSALTLSVSPAGLGSYTWSPGGASTSTITVSPVVPQTIYTVGATASGCATSIPVTVTVNVNPLPTYTIAPSNSPSVCAGQSQVLSVSGASTYTWSTGAVASSITVTPALTTTYSVIGTDALSCTNPVAETATVIVNQLPSYTISPNAPINICNGGTASFTVSGASTYTWSTGQQTAGITVTPTATTVYSVTGTSGAGCNNITPATVTVNVSAPPTLSISVSSDSICSGGSVTLSVTPSNLVSYTWSPTSTLTGATSATPVASPVNTTTYTVTGTASGCAPSPSQTIAITVNPLPDYTITTGAPPVICNGASQVLTVSGANTYTWSTTQTTASISVSPTVTTTYSVVGTSSLNCINATSAIITVTVNPLPVYSIAPDSVFSICNGGSTSFTVSGANSYTWMPGATLNDSTIANPTATPTTQTIYSVIGTSTANCINPIPLTVTVNVTAPPTLTLSAPSDTICSGGTKTLGVSGATTYTWMPASTLTGANTASPTANPTTTTIYTVTGTETGCAPSPSQTVALIVHNTPTVNLNGAIFDTVKCTQPGGITNINLSNVGNGTAPYTFQWTNLITGSTFTSVTTPSFTNQPAGTYSLLVTDANGCIATNSGTVSTTQVVPSLSISVSFTNNPNPAMGGIPLPVSFTNTSVNVTTYTWTFGNGDTSHLFNPPQITYTANGTYTVVLYAQNGGCLDSMKTVVVTDIPTTLIIPNIFSPNGDGINDQFFIINTGLVSLNCVIYNRWGELLFTIYSANEAWDGRTPNGGNAPDGTYFYILQAQGNNGKTYKQDGPLTLIR